jgi:hypothetical protein
VGVVGARVPEYDAARLHAERAAKHSNIRNTFVLIALMRLQISFQPRLGEYNYSPSGWRLRFSELSAYKASW